MNVKICWKYVCRIPLRKSLFDGYLSSYTNCGSYIKGGIVCNCLAHVFNCSLAMISKYTVTSIPLINIKPRIPYTVGAAGRSYSGRRDTGFLLADTGYFLAEDNIDYGYDSSNYAYAEAVTNHSAEVNLTWPTRTGITQVQAQSYCNEILWLNSTLLSVCNQALSSSEIQNVVNKCVQDIQVWNSLVPHYTLKKLRWAPSLYWIL